MYICVPISVTFAEISLVSSQLIDVIQQSLFTLNTGSSTQLRILFQLENLGSYVGVNFLFCASVFSVIFRVMAASESSLSKPYVFRGAAHVVTVGLSSSQLVVSVEDRVTGNQWKGAFSATGQ